jgi:ankyrin repeat protein
LIVTCVQGHAVIVRELLARGADVNARDNHGRSALHAASYNGRAEAMRELLKRHDVDINAQDGVGDTPLIDACAQSHLMAATFLIGAGADLALVNNAGRSALFHAEHRVRQDVHAPAAPPAAPPAAGAAPPPAVVTEAQRAEHKALVAVLKAHGAT